MDGESKASRAPRVSVVIVVWNALRFLRPCLGSIYRHETPALVRDFEARPSAAEKDPQAGPGAPTAASVEIVPEIEVFVVDNGSTDGSPEMVAAEFPQIRLIRLTENLGYPAANNIALRVILAERSADAVIFLNSDTVVEDAALDRLADYLAMHPDVAAVVPALVLPGGRFQTGTCGFLPTARTLFSYFFGFHKILPVRSRSFFIDQKSISRRVPFLPVEWLSGACLAVRREVIERVGLLSEDYFFYAEDLDWGRRMTAAGLIRHYWPGARIIHAHGMTYQSLFRETNTAWLRMLFQYLRRERGRTEYLLGRFFAVCGFLLRFLVRAVLSFPWTRRESRRKIRDAFRFFTFSLTGI